MANITDASVIKFANEDIRPLCEKLRNLKAEIEDAQARYWQHGINTVLDGRGDDVLEDGRADTGVSQLTGSDITNVITRIGEVQTLLDGANKMDVVHKACVRSLKV